MTEIESVNHAFLDMKYFEFQNMHSGDEIVYFWWWWWNSTYNTAVYPAGTIQEIHCRILLLWNFKTLN